MGKLITLSIDLTLLDRARFKRVTKKSGTQATYCDLVLYETENRQYGDYIVKQAVTKEERMQKVQMPILGNAKEWGGSPKEASNATQQQPSSTGGDEGDTSVPF